MLKHMFSKNTIDKAKYHEFHGKASKLFHVKSKSHVECNIVAC